MTLTDHGSPPEVISKAANSAFSHGRTFGAMVSREGPRGGNSVYHSADLPSTLPGCLLEPSVFGFVFFFFLFLSHFQVISLISS